MGGTVRYSVACDIGGTFTDLVLLGSDGSVRTAKVSSTPADYSLGIATGITELIATHGIDPTAISGVVHATTVVTNTILEMRGARTALVTTAGFRDVLEMRRLRIPILYDLQYDKPPPLAPRRWRFEATERMGPRGQVLIPLDEAGVDAIGRRLADAGISAVAVAFLHSYANPDHEHRAAAILRRWLGPDAHITCSADILPEIREYERTSTAVVNAYVGPVVQSYLRSLEGRLAATGVRAPLRIMQSNGGAMTAQAATQKPAYIVESGPAAGVIACAHLARQMDLPNVISFDMGGTTAKAAIVENGEPSITTEYEVGAGINLSSKLVKGGGYAIKLPFIDVSEIGAGGGSLVRVDDAGSLRVGPQSAGAVPGPACYGLGSDAPTFTDAAVVLGLVSRERLVGGRLPIQAQRSFDALRRHVAEPLGLDLDRAAFGTYVIAVANMTRAVKAVSTYRGRDPRDFTLMAFGGNGPVVAAAVARELGMRRVAVPPWPGVFSACGLLFARIEHAFQRTHLKRIDVVTQGELEDVFTSMEAEAREVLLGERARLDGSQFRRFAELRYSGQAYELTIALGPGVSSPAEIRAAFDAEHLRTYGHASATDPIDLVNLRLTAAGGEDMTALQFDRAAILAFDRALDRPASRSVYFGPRPGTVETPVLGRHDLAQAPVQGPCIVEEFDATCVVPPGASASLDAFGNIVIDVGEAP